MDLDFLKLSKISDLNKNLIPVVIQNIKNMEVIMLAYSNKKALELSILNKEVCLWSTSRDELWHKGATSGNRLKLINIKINCENNSLLYQVELICDGACHEVAKNGKHYSSCFFRDYKSI